MTTICTDTNIWVDFYALDALSLPFLLPHTFLIYAGSLRREITDKFVYSTLVEKGIKPVDFYSVEEFFEVAEICQKYPKLPQYDAAALVIAKNRQIPLATGDGLLRKAAQNNNLPLYRYRSIRLLDELLKFGNIGQNEYRDILLKAQSKNGGIIRWPEQEVNHPSSKANGIPRGKISLKYICVSCFCIKTYRKRINIWS